MGNIINRAAAAEAESARKTRLAKALAALVPYRSEGEATPEVICVLTRLAVINESTKERAERYALAYNRHNPGMVLKGAEQLSLAWCFSDRKPKCGECVFAQDCPEDFWLKLESGSR